MSVDVVTRTEIARPREDVASFAADPSNATAWSRRRCDGRTGPTSPASNAIIEEAFATAVFALEREIVGPSGSGSTA